MESQMRTAAPVRPLAGYVGGKKLLARHVIAAIERVPHRTYCEAFVGMGGVFFRRRRAPKAEAINDLNRDVAGFFRVLQRHYQALMDMLKWQVTSRAEFERLAGQDPATLTDLAGDAVLPRSALSRLRALLRPRPLRAEGIRGAQRSFEGPSRPVRADPQ